MRMQAFLMLNPDIKCFTKGCTTKNVIEPTGSIFAKHQILTVSHRKSLFVAPLDNRLHGCPESNFSIINQFNHRQ
ncbi:Uncharacterised protein [Klebsiella pneumoniae]|nr:Uncharacterised protein [Klebsiella pneumoniae]SVS09448.1 Uncharacterised protein [Klebsiella pneumoniae]VGG65093.1 Uncharacterised protein [Klebsiella pneumoniae]VTM12454.1 Uncharacterised protein [Klebsiella pneumoniae]